MSRFLMRLAARIPLRIAHALGSILGWAIYALSPAYRRHLRENMALAGYRDARMRRAAIAESGKMLAELPALWFRPHAEVVALVRGLDGVEEAWAARERGEPLLFLAPHLGCFEITSQYTATRVPLTVLFRPPKSGWLEPLMREGRERPNIRMLRADYPGLRRLVAALRRGEAIGFLPDQVPGEGEGEWVEFFGKPAYTMTLAARLVERPRQSCFLAYARRLPRGEGYVLSMRRLPPALPGEGAARRVNRALEALIRECPEQYLWSYNRYKTPKGARRADA
ncbi:MAG TPA: lysophospholipid acyltransferase family protein [Burkholderiales bacterium]|nr:lysophospholipid acyltransferase family protein [Burkholderiales bacterium]